MGGKTPKGVRYGGRQKGTPNKTTIEKAKVIAEQVHAQGQTAGIAVMRQVMNYFMGLAAKYQATDEAKSAKYAEKGGNMAIRVTEYESPKLQSTTIRHDAPKEPIRVQIEFV